LVARIRECMKESVKGTTREVRRLLQMSKISKLIGQTARITRAKFVTAA
jgi:hypothetical protein